MSEFSVSGQLAVITGAGDGIGKAIAIKLGFEGCNVALVDIRGDKVNEVATNIQSLFPSIKVYAYQCDVTNINAIQKLVQKIKTSFNTKTIQLLFNNVGIGGIGSTLYGDIIKLRREFDVNLWSMVYGTRLFLPMLLANDPKQQCFIINTGSIASIESGFSWYSVSKHAVIAFSETVREELKRMHPKYNIFVSTLVPAFVNTNIRKNSAMQLGDSEKWDKFSKAWEKSKQGQMVKLSEINVNVVADIVYEALKNKKAVIPTHLDWHEAVIKDRMNGLLNCEKDKKSNMRKAVKNRIVKAKQSKL
eukprot:373766_1